MHFHGILFHQYQILKMSQSDWDQNKSINEEKEPNPLTAIKYISHFTGTYNALCLDAVL